MSYNYLPLDHTPTTFQQIKNLIAYKQLISITFTGYEAVGKCRDYLDAKLADGKLYLGINTGVGNLQNQKIDDAQIEKLQYDLLQNNANSLGDPVPDVIVKLMLALKVKSLGYGHSGVQNETIQRLMDMHNNDVLPVVYTQGSMADVCLPIIGMGEVTHDGKKYKGQELEKIFGWKPLKLRSKEALALISGTEFTSAYGLFCLVKAHQLIKMADLISAISFEAFGCDPKVFDEHINFIRPQKGQVATSNMLRSYLLDSGMPTLNFNGDNDPQSFRCIPQVHGITKDAFDHVLKIFIQEINSVTDNPSIFPDKDLILDSGDSNAQSLTFNLDFLANAVNQLGSISRRRTDQLLGGKRGLPLFLEKNKVPGTDFEMLQNMTVEMVNENRQLCKQGFGHSVFYDANQEDITAPSGIAPVKCLKLLHNIEKILAIEMLCAAQAKEIKRPAISSAIIEKAIAAFKETISANQIRNEINDDLAKAAEFVSLLKI